MPKVKPKEKVTKPTPTSKVKRKRKEKVTKPAPTPVSTIDELQGAMAYIDTLNNGHQPDNIITEDQSDKRYREFVIQTVPEEYKYMTPDWLYGSLDWHSRVQCLRPEPSSNIRQKIQIGMAVTVLILFGVVVFLILVIAMG